MHFDEEQNRGVSKCTHLEKGQKVIRSEITSLGEMSEFWAHPHNFLKSFKHREFIKFLSSTVTMRNTSPWCVGHG